MTDKDKKMEMNKYLVDTYSLTKDDFWKAEKGNWVIRSSALRKIAAIEHITCSIDCVDVKEFNGFPFVATIVTATIREGDQRYHYQASACAWNDNLATKISKAYPVEMAEKRAADRAIIRALGLDADGVYSDSEADDFKRAPTVKIEGVEQVTDKKEK